MNINKNKKILIVLGVGLLLLLTNPDEDRFKKFLSEDLKKEAHADNEVSGAIMDVLSKPTAWVMSLSTKRTNLLFFSIYNVSPGDSEYTYLGLLGFFVRIG